MSFTVLVSVSSSISNTISLNLTFSGAAYVLSLCLHSSTSNFGFWKLYSIYSIRAEPEKSSSGNTLLKTFWRPLSGRSDELKSSSRKSSYEFFWISIRLGNLDISFSLPKFLRTLFLSVKDNVLTINVYSPNHNSLTRIGKKIRIKFILVLQLRPQLQVFLWRHSHHL